MIGLSTGVGLQSDIFWTFMKVLFLKEKLLLFILKDNFIKLVTTW